MKLCSCYGDPMENTKKMAPDFWSWEEDDDDLTFTDIDEAIEDYLDFLYPEETPRRVEFYGYTRVTVTVDDLPSPLDCMMDRLRSDPKEILFPDGVKEDQVTPAMREAEAAFLAVVARELVPWRCEVTTSQTVDLTDWCAANRPEGSE